MISLNRRQFQRMLEVIETGRVDTSSLVNVADSLHFLLSDLEAVDHPWAERFGSLILTLESAGLVSANQRQEMGGSLPSLRAQTLDALEAMVREKMGTMDH